MTTPTLADHTASLIAAEQILAKHFPKYTMRERMEAAIELSRAESPKVALTDRTERCMSSLIMEWLDEAGVPGAPTLARKIAANLRPTIDAELSRLMGGAA